MRRPLLSAVLILCAAVVAHVQEQERDKVTSERFSPLGFDDFRAYSRRIPASRTRSPSSARPRANTGCSAASPIAAQQAGGARMGEPRSAQHHRAAARAAQANFSGRVAALAISPACEVTARAVSGPAPRAAACGAPTMPWNAADPAGAGSAGLGTNSIGALDRRSQRRQRRHDLRRHRRDEYAAELRRRHRPLSIDRRRRSLDARLDEHRRFRRVAVGDRLHVHARHQLDRDRARQPEDDLRRHDDARCWA